MFVFARGFEAATLKIPASIAAARERDAAAATAVSAIAATLPQYSNPAHNLDGYGTPGSTYGGNSYEQSLYDEGYRGSVSSVSGPAAAQAVAEGAQRVSSALAAAAISASASSASLPTLASSSYQGFPGAAANKKQIIGFAKFRTREDAMEARDALSGRRIDAERNSVLKAEMAKKNLHVKRHPGDPAGVPSMVGAGPEYPPLSSSTRGSASALDRLAEQDREWRARIAAREAQQAALLEVAAGRGSAAGRYGYSLPDQPTQGTSATLDDEVAWSAFHSVPSAETHAVSADPRFSASARGSPEDETPYLGLAIDRTPSAARARSSTSGSARNAAMAGTSPIPLGGGKTLLQQLEEQEEADLPDTSQLSTLSANPPTGFGESRQYSGSFGQPVSAGIVRRNVPPALPTASLGGQTYIDQDFSHLALSSSVGSGAQAPVSPTTLNASSGASFAQSFGATGPSSNTPTSAIPLSAGYAASQRQYAFASLTSPNFAEFRVPSHAGPGSRADDNNMPISTLYVGGLPSALPSVTSPLSPGQLEETLREVFSTCPGFRRLSFRQKSQGYV